MQSAQLKSTTSPGINAERCIHALVKNFPFIIFSFSIDGTIQYADGAALKSLGIPATEAVGKNIYHLYKNVSWMQTAISQVIAEKRALAASGPISNGVVDFWYDAHYVPVFDNDGHLSDIIGYSVDMTSEKRARDQMEKLAEEKIAAMTASIDGLATIGADGDLKYANDSFMRIYQIDSIVGKNWRTFFAPDEITRLLDIVKEALLHRRHWRGEVIAKRTNGDHFFSEVSISQIYASGQVKGAVFVIRDITDQKTESMRQALVMQAAAALAESLDYEITLKKVANYAVKKFASWCVVTLVNEQGSIERVIVGADPGDQDVSALLSEVPFRCSENYINKRVHITHQINEAHEVNEDFFNRFFPNEADRRRFSPLSISAFICVPLMVSTTFLGAITFIKSRKKTGLAESPFYNEQDTAAAVEVAGRMALAVQNAKLYSEAKDAVRSREDLIAAVSHDLKNPLSAIAINAELIARASESSTRASVFKKLSGTIRVSVDRMTALIKELLELEKLRGGEFVISKGPTSASTIVDIALAEIEPIALQKSISLSKVMPNEPLFMNADQDRLLQVFSNLLGNAVKFTPQNGKIQVSCISLIQEIKFSVEDSGPGIPKKDLPRIFDRYWRSQMSDKMGAGIGLTIARAIVGAHGGSIWAESTLGRGSTFSFTIPYD